MLKKWPHRKKDDSLKRKRGEQIFFLTNQRAYEAWREKKLGEKPKNLVDRLVTIANPLAVSRDEKRQIMELCRISNMAVYRVSSRFGGE